MVVAAFHKTLNPGVKFDPTWIENVHVNLPSIHQYLDTLLKNRCVTGENRAGWLLRAVSMIDLTTLAGDDTWVNVSRLCHKARIPLQPEVMRALVGDNKVTVAAVCVYPAMVEHAMKTFGDIGVSNIPVCSVTAGFPSGLYGLESRLEEIYFAVKNGAKEIDIVISRWKVLQGDWAGLYEEVKACKEACGPAKMKTILGVGELGSMENIYRASMVSMMAGSDFIKTSTGKEAVNATLPIGLVMCRAIRDYRRRTGYKVGLKPAGGLKTSTHALNWLVLVHEELGSEYLNNSLFRIGASSLLTEVEKELISYATGKKATPDMLSMA